VDLSGAAREAMLFFDEMACCCGSAGRSSPGAGSIFFHLDNRIMENVAYIYRMHRTVKQIVISEFDDLCDLLFFLGS
jgi:hypothetical protein